MNQGQQTSQQPMAECSAESPIALAYAPDENHPLVEAVLRWQGETIRRPRLEIAHGDAMFRYFQYECHRHRGLALARYFTTGHSAAQFFLDLLRAHFGQLAAVHSLLDFGSGYGRVARYLVAALPDAHLVACEADPLAAPFLREVIFPTAVTAGLHPQAINDGERYDAILAASVFSHFSHDTFIGWLRQLWTQVADNGLLAFSVHPAEHRLSTATPSRPGFWFEPFNETVPLDPSIYGTSWVEQDFVLDVIAAHCPGSCPAVRFERALWHGQDLYLVTRGRPWPRGMSLPLPPVGHIDEAFLVDSNLLHLSGWCVDRSTTGQPPTIEICLDGTRVASLSPTEPRSDVAERWRCPAEQTGFSARYRSEARIDPGAVLTVSATGSSLRRSLLLAAEVDGADLCGRVHHSLEEIRTESLHVRRQLREHQDRLKAFEQSKLVNWAQAWWRLRGKLGGRPSNRTAE